MNADRSLVVTTSAAVLLAVLLAATIAMEGVRKDRETQTQQKMSIARGALLYNTHCADCHGHNGQGLAGFYTTLNVEDPWAGREQMALTGNLHDYVYETIAAGHPERNMPSWSMAFGGSLRDEQIGDLSQFVLNWMGPRPGIVRPAAVVRPDSIEPRDPGDPLRGEEIFGQACAGCHEADAGGGPHGPSLVAASAAAKTDNAYRRAIINGRPGTPMVPWAWARDLSPQDIDDLIAFLRSRQ